MCACVCECHTEMHLYTLCGVYIRALKIIFICHLLWSSRYIHVASIREFVEECIVFRAFPVLEASANSRAFRFRL